MELKFAITVNTSVLYDYLLRHTYSSAAGLLGTIVGALVLVGYTANGQIWTLIAGIVILIWQPFILYRKAWKQAQDPMFRDPLRYRMTEEGVEMMRGGNPLFWKWEDMVKAISTTQSVILYTDKNNACIFPKRDLGDHLPKLIEMISIHMPAAKVNIRL